MRFETKAYRVFACFCAALVMMALMGCGGETILLKELVSESSVIYVCRKEGSEFVVKRILRNRDPDRVELSIGKSVLLNMTTFGINRDRDGIDIVVFVLPGDKIATPSNFLRQSEIPVNRDGTLSGTDGTFGDLVELIRNEDGVIQGRGKVEGR